MAILTEIVDAIGLTCSQMGLQNNRSQLTMRQVLHSPNASLPFLIGTTTMHI